MINKKYCKIRANVSAKIKEQYLGKYGTWMCEIINLFINQLWTKYLCQLNFPANRDGDNILDYKDIWELMTLPTALKFMDSKNKKTVYNFVCKS